MIRYATYFFISSFILGACTNARWIVEDQQAVDENDYRLISSKQFPEPAGRPTPDDPVLRLQILSKNTYEYSEKVLMARYVQDYKIRPFFFTAGLLGAGITFYVANSGDVDGINGQIETIALNAAGGIIALGSLMNFKPTGEPRPTGEERFLRTTGSRVVGDTVQVKNPAQTTASVTIFYAEQTVTNNLPVNINDGILEIDLGFSLSKLEIAERDPDPVRIHVNYDDSTYFYQYPLSTILRPFAKVETPVTELRNSPNENPDNILAELVEGSLLQIVEETGRWYKVLYGISENFVLKSDVSQVWHTSDFAMGNRVVAIPTVPFGDIDVENNIPILTETNPDGYALIIGNQNYTEPYETRKYTERDVRLIDTYLVNALGYPEDQVHMFTNLQGTQPVDSVLNILKRTATDSSEIVVYLSGYGTLKKNNDKYDLYYLTTSVNRDSALNLSDLLNSITQIPSKWKLIINEIDFRQSVRELSESNQLEPFQRPLQSFATSVTVDNEDTAILFSSAINQQSYIYLGEQEDNKHHIFPYFFAKAIQNRNTVLSQIYQFLLRNVSYTSRKLHDEPQEPVLFGNTDIDLAVRQ